MSHKGDGATQPTVDVESILTRDRGSRPGLSRYQLRAVALCAFLSIFDALASHEYVFTTGRIQTRCLIPECESTTEQLEFSPIWIENAVPQTDSGFDNCRRYANDTSNEYDYTDNTCPATLFNQTNIVKCEKYVYENTNTVVHTLGLACNEWRRSFLGSARMIGAFLSLPISGFISDRWGRRIALFICCFNVACMGILRVFANTYIGFIASVFAEASLGGGALTGCCYVLAVEAVPVKYRVVTGVVILSICAISQILLSVLAWSLPNWKHLTLVIYVPFLFGLSCIWFIPESLRWLLSKGKYAKAELALKKMAKINKTELSETSMVELKQAVEIEKNKTKKEDYSKEPSLLRLVFRYKLILLRVLTAPLWWITTVLVYHGLGLNAVDIAGNKYLNYALVSAVDIPGFWTPVFILDRFGRKAVIIAGFWSCAACQIIYIFMPTGYYAASLVVYLVGKYTIAIVAISIYTYTSELYPTPYRHRLFGYTSMMGRIGSIMTPLTPALSAVVWAELPFALFAGLALVSGLLVMLLPETRGCRLPDTMQEAADLGKPDDAKRNKSFENNPTSMDRH